MQALNPNKQTCIGKEADVRPQTKQTNIYRCGSEEVVLTLAKKFGTKFVIDTGQIHSGVYRHALACKKKTFTVSFIQPYAVLVSFSQTNSYF